MKVQLFDQGGEYIAERVIPPFTLPPEVILWGYRAFVAPSAEQQALIEAHTKPNDVAYVEAFAYLIPDTAPRTKFIRPFSAHESETVEIQWATQQGEVFRQRVQIPPKATRDVRTTPGE